VGCTRLGSFLVTSLIQAPGKQHTSLESVSGRQMGACECLGRESPTAITRRLFLVVFAVLRGADRAAVLGSSVSPDVMGLSSSVCREVKWFCKGTSGVGEVSPSCWCLPLQASILLHYLSLSLLCVPLGEFLAVWRGLWINCRLHLEPTVSLLPSLPDVMQPAHHRLQLSHLPQEVLHQGTPSVGRSATNPCPRRKV